MDYLYHHVPKNLNGTILFPLNDLKSILPDTFESQVSKYRGREYITQQRIPQLNNCLWNDVIFLTAIDPQKLFDARKAAGWGDIPPQQYFKIALSSIEERDLAVYLFKFKGTNNRSGVKSDDFTEFRRSDLARYRVLPQATKDYFRSEHERGEPRIRLFYRYVPHILYKGKIDISKTEIITVS